MIYFTIHLPVQDLVGGTLGHNVMRAGCGPTTGDTLRFTVWSCRSPRPSRKISLNINWTTKLYMYSQ